MKTSREKALNFFTIASEQYPGRTASQAISILLQIKEATSRKSRGSLINAFADLQTDADAIGIICRAANTRHAQSNNSLIKNRTITEGQVISILKLESDFIRTNRSTGKEELLNMLKFLSENENEVIDQRNRMEAQMK